MEQQIINNNKKGSLVCVGAGINIGAHITPLSRNHIEQADVVFAGASDGIFELWLQQMHPNVISLQQYYADGKSRKITYQEMAEAMLYEVRRGKNVVAAFYGHPGVFVYPSHKAIKIAKQEGYTALMIPGISAEDCLYADLGIDPGKYGCQMYETSQFMFYKRLVDPSAYLILWQVAFAGDKSHTILNTGEKYRAILIQLLCQLYDSDHQVILYEAASNALQSAKIIKIKLEDLVKVEISMKTTLVIPPSIKLQHNHEVIDRITRLQKSNLTTI